MSRLAEIERKTKETEIFIKLNLDEKGEAKLDYPVRQPNGSSHPIFMVVCNT